MHVRIALKPVCNALRYKLAYGYLRLAFGIVSHIGNGVALLRYILAYHISVCKQGFPRQKQHVGG